MIKTWDNGCLMDNFEILFVCPHNVLFSKLHAYNIVLGISLTATHATFNAYKNSNPFGIYIYIVSHMECCAYTLSWKLHTLALVPYHARLR